MVQFKHSVIILNMIDEILTFKTVYFWFKSEELEICQVKKAKISQRISEGSS